MDTTKVFQNNCSGKKSMISSRYKKFKIEKETTFMIPIEKAIANLGYPRRIKFYLSELGFDYFDHLSAYEFRQLSDRVHHK